MYFYFLNVIFDILTIIIKIFCTCCGEEGDFSDKVNLYSRLFLDNLLFFGCFYYLFLYNFNNILQNSTFSALTIENMHHKRSKKILSFNINLSMIQSLKLLQLISIFMLTYSLYIEYFLICIQDLDSISPFYGLRGNFAVFVSFVYVRFYYMMIIGVH
jgi:hypothetical protein